MSRAKDITCNFLKMGAQHSDSSAVRLENWQPSNALRTESLRSAKRTTGMKFVHIGKNLAEATNTHWFSAVTATTWGFLSSMKFFSFSRSFS